MCSSFVLTALCFCPLCPSLPLGFKPGRRSPRIIRKDESAVPQSRRDIFFDGVLICIGEIICQILLPIFLFRADPFLVSKYFFLPGVAGVFSTFDNFFSGFCSHGLSFRTIFVLRGGSASLMPLVGKCVLVYSARTKSFF